MRGNKMTGHTDKYCEIPILVKHDALIRKLAFLTFVINYNINAFGINAVNNTTVSFPVASCYGANITNFSTNRLQLQISPNNPFPCNDYLRFTGAWDTICIIKIKYQDCRMNSLIGLVPFATSVYRYTINDTTYADFNGVATASVNYGGQTCFPEITEVYGEDGTSNVRGGVGDTLYIKGKHFGYYRNASNTNQRVYMKNADIGPDFYLKLNSIDHVFWNDTFIKIIVPSTVDVNTGSSNYKTYTLGSGRIGVGNLWNIVDTVELGNPERNMNIEWSANNYSRGLENPLPNTYYKNNAWLMPSRTSGDYTFKMHGSISNPKIKDCIRAAINKWRCYTGVNFKLDETPTTDVINGLDQKNTIQITNTNVSSIVSTIKRAKTCANPDNTRSAFPISDIDIEIDASDTINFMYDTTGTISKDNFKIDFYAVMLHELGHSLLISHVRDENDLMYYKALINEFQSALLRRNIKPENEEVGDYITINSSNSFNLVDSCSSYTAHLLQEQVSNCTTVGINETKNIENQTLLFPNPTNNSFQITNLDNNKTYDLVIYNAIGQIIFKQSKYLNEQVVDINFPEGIYFVHIKSSDTNLKFIKLCVQ